MKRAEMIIQLPKIITVGEFSEIVYWSKSFVILDFEHPFFRVKVSLKPEYANNMMDQIQKTITEKRKLYEPHLWYSYGL